MLQQTQVVTVIDYYHRFLKKFPTIQSLAEADEKDVLALWSGLGYYSRAKNLQKAAQKIMTEFEGKFPQNPENILSLPGIGRYTLGAIGSIAFDLPLALVDGNVIRVYARLFALKGSPSDTKFQKRIWEIAEKIMWRAGDATGAPHFCQSASGGPNLGVRSGRTRSPGDFNQALMELGATLCTPQNPTCLICPVQSLCKGKANPETYPEKKKRTQTEKLHRLAAVVMTENEILLCLSPKHRWMKELWQLPSQFVKNKKETESLLNHLKNIGISSNELSPLQQVKHHITHHHITIQPYMVRTKRCSPKTQDGEKYVWQNLSTLKQLALPSADRKILERII